LFCNIYYYVTATSFLTLRFYYKLKKASKKERKREGERQAARINTGFPASVAWMAVASKGSGPDRARICGLCHGGPRWLCRPHLSVCLCGGRHNWQDRRLARV